MKGQLENHHRQALKTSKSEAQGNARSSQPERLFVIEFVEYWDNNQMGLRYVNNARIARSTRVKSRAYRIFTAQDDFPASH